MSPTERTALLSLVPYFSDERIVFDVGSNKGEWVDPIVKNSEVHLFEPNVTLLHYTMIKYDTLTNVKYNELAVYKEDNRELNFYYFTNENNGLSSLYNYEEWSKLPRKVALVTTIKLDTYCLFNKIDHIDFLKIDVEGAEFDVIEGARKMLKSGNIKFVQIEYGFHYQTHRRTFREMIDIMAGYGFAPYTEDLSPVVVDRFIEDYRLENFIFMPKEFTQDWNAEFKKNTKGIPQFNFALEIGAFEGLTTTYICDNLLLPGGRIICVDPLEDRYTDTATEDLNKLFVGQFERFQRNTKGYPVELIRKKSNEVFDQLKDFRFDFIFIDGDHSKSAVYGDGVTFFPLLKKGGYMLFDDYKWREETTKGIDLFLRNHQGSYEIIHKDYQLLVRKTV